MNNKLEKTKLGINPIIDNCQKANENYITYLKKYYIELINQDAKLTRKDQSNELFIQGGIKLVKGKDTSKEQKQLTELSEPEDLGLLILAKNLLKKDTSREIKQLKELKKPRIQLIPTNLDTINNTIKRILSERGWD